MNNKEKLNVLKMIYGPKVVCTNGLFHIIEDDHREVYINNATQELDKRTTYKTIEVTDKSIIAFDLNNSHRSKLGVKLVRTEKDLIESDNITEGTIILLNKSNLEYKYTTKNQLRHIKNDVFIACDSKNSEIISNNGETKVKLDNCNSIINIYKNIYLCQSMHMFNDKLVIIDDKCKVIDLTENRRYRIKQIDSEQIRIELMCGGQYIVDLKTKKCLNIFTKNYENSINLFSLIL